MLSLAAWLDMSSRHYFLFLAPADTSRLEGSSGFHHLPPQQPLSQNRILAFQGQHLLKNVIPSSAAFLLSSTYGISHIRYPAYQIL